MKKPIKVLLIILVSLLILAGVCAILWFNVFNPHRGVTNQFDNALPLDTLLTPDEAIKDIDFMYNTLKSRHPAWLEDSNEAVAQIDSIYREEKSYLAALKASYNTEKASDSVHNGTTVSVLELWRVYSRMLALLHDGHTAVWWPNNDQHFINDFTQAMTLGKPVAVDGVPAETLLSTFMEMASWETEKGAERTFFNSYYLSEHYMKLCGIDTSDGVTITWNVNGTPTDFHYTFVSGKDIFYPDDATLQAILAEQTTTNQATDEQASSNSGTTPKTVVETTKPLGNYIKYNEMCKNATDYVWYFIDKEYNLAVLALAECNYDNHYIEVVNNFFNEVFEADITNIAVDLRGNGGGSSTVADEFLHHIDIESYNGWDSSVRYGPILYKNKDVVFKNIKYDKVFSGNLYILTNINSYSSAMDFAMLVSDNNLGKIVGEASGNNPESYGDRLDFQLPVTKLGFSASFKKWYRVDRSKSGQLIEPDYPCEPNEALMNVYQIINK